MTRALVIFRSVAPLLLASLVALVAGCPGRLPPEDIPSGSGGSTGVASCADAPRIIDMHCLACHGSPPAEIFASLDLEADGVAQRLVGQAADTGSFGLCAGQGNLLDPGTLPATGILIDKLRFTHDCGAGMPLGALAPLPAADVDCLQTWANGLVMTAGGN